MYVSNRVTIATFLLKRATAESNPNGTCEGELFLASAHFLKSATKAKADTNRLEQEIVQRQRVLPDGRTIRSVREREEGDGETR
jgi:hypothetical protein